MPEAVLFGVIRDVAPVMLLNNISDPECLLLLSLDLSLTLTLGTTA